ncbi:MAG TPA: ABC transporter permease subunit [Anaerovoracaceae bacterium]|nr:ABC transporter permease subunit [Anaerovoracaceae bacterium]
MNNFSNINVFTLTRFDLKNNGKLILVWSIATFAITFLYMILFSSMQDMALAEWDNMPVEVLQFMGVESFRIMADYNGYFGMMYNLLLIVISIFTTTFSAGIINKEEKSKSIEFLYSCPVSRVEIYVSKLITALIGLLIVLSSLIASATICGFLNGGDTFILSDFFQIALISGFIAVFYMGVALFIGGLTGKLPVSMISAMVVVFTYLIGYLGELLKDKGEFLLYLSPFQIFSPTNALELRGGTITNLIIYGIILLGLIAIGCAVYRKRDFKI